MVTTTQQVLVLGLALACASSSAFQPRVLSARAVARWTGPSPTTIRATVEPEAVAAGEQATAVEAIPLPRSLEQQIAAMGKSITRAREDGVNRQRVRALLPRNGVLVPPDETWEGGIMELYYAITPMVKRTLRLLTPPVSGVPPRFTENRIDASTVDGEALWTVQAASAKDDVCAFVQPSVENRKDIEQTCESAGERVVLMFNPQYRESDDTLDYLSKSNGLFKAVATFLGGKAAFVERLDELGFVDTFNLQSNVIRGSEMFYYKTYPGDWRIYILGDDDEPIYLGESKDRPDYNKIDDLLETNGVAQKFQRELNMFPPLTKSSITTLYSDE